MALLHRLAHALYASDDLRRVQPTSIGQGRVGDGELENRDPDVAAADRGVECRHQTRIRAVPCAVGDLAGDLIVDAQAGGELFEPKEENPMLGWRGASRYYHPAYREGFLLECAAVRRVRETFGLENLALMVPFCRTPEEGARVLETAASAGLVRGERGLRWYVMAEIPSNILLAERFAELFDGFSIGSNDLTQLILGVDRDSERVAPLFDERNEAVKRACAMLIESAHRAGRTVGICGQAPSDYPEFAAFLVEQGIDSLSLSPDALVASRRRIAALEALREAGPAARAG